MDLERRGTGGRTGPGSRGRTPQAWRPKNPAERRRFRAPVCFASRAFSRAPAPPPASRPCSLARRERKREKERERERERERKRERERERRAGGIELRGAGAEERRSGLWFHDCQHQGIYDRSNGLLKEYAFSLALRSWLVKVAPSQPGLALVERNEPGCTEQALSSLDLT